MKDHLSWKESITQTNLRRLDGQQITRQNYKLDIYTCTINFYLGKEKSKYFNYWIFSYIFI